VLGAVPAALEAPLPAGTTVTLLCKPGFAAGNSSTGALFLSANQQPQPAVVVACNAEGAPQGYGLTCVDVDECSFASLNQCAEVCINTAGAFHCACADPAARALDADNTTCFQRLAVLPEAQLDARFPSGSTLSLLVALNDPLLGTADSSFLASATFEAQTAPGLEVFALGHPLLSVAFPVALLPAQTQLFVLTLTNTATGQSARTEPILLLQTGVSLNDTTAVRTCQDSLCQNSAQCQALQRFEFRALALANSSSSSSANLTSSTNAIAASFQNALVSLRPTSSDAWSLQAVALAADLALVWGTYGGPASDLDFAIARVAIDSGDVAVSAGFQHLVSVPGSLRLDQRRDSEGQLVEEVPARQFQCECAQGFAGDLCESEIDECAAAPCFPGTCLDAIASFSCDCSGTGFVGTDLVACRPLFPPQLLRAASNTVWFVVGCAFAPPRANLQAARPLCSLGFAQRCPQRVAARQHGPVWAGCAVYLPARFRPQRPSGGAHNDTRALQRQLPVDP
jgi:hypothetical protein